MSSSMETANVGTARSARSRLGAIALMAAGALAMILAAAAWKFRSSIDEAQPAAVAPTVAEVPRHQKSYAMRDGQEYGYVAAISEEDKRRGMAAAPVQMYRFYGNVGDKYQIGTVSGASAILVEGSPPFEFATIYSFYDQRLVEKQVMRLLPNSIFALALNDAFYGDLQQYRGTRDGKPGHLEFDAKATRMVFVADK